MNETKLLGTRYVVVTRVGFWTGQTDHKPATMHDNLLVASTFSSAEEALAAFKAEDKNYGNVTPYAVLYEKANKDWKQAWESAVSEQTWKLPQEPQSAANLPNFKVMVTLHSADGWVGQGILGLVQPLVWDVVPDRETVQAIVSRIDSNSLSVVELATLEGDDWRKFQDSNAEASLVAKVVSGHTLEAAFEGVPVRICTSSARK